MLSDLSDDKGWADLEAAYNDWMVTKRDWQAKGKWPADADQGEPKGEAIHLVPAVAPAPRLQKLRPEIVNPTPKARRRAPAVGRRIFGLSTMPRRTKKPIRTSMRGGP